jgi:hypothetical protein
MSLDGDSVFKVERQRVERVLPAWSDLVSITCFWFDEFSDGQVEHLHCGLLGREMTPVGSHLSRPGIDRLDVYLKFRK